MAVRLDYQPIRRVENSSSGSMDKTNQSDFVTTVGLGIKKNLTGCFWMDLQDNYSNNSWLKLINHTLMELGNKSFEANIFFSIKCSMFMVTIITTSI